MLASIADSATAAAAADSVSSPCSPSAAAASALRKDGMPTYRGSHCVRHGDSRARRARTCIVDTADLQRLIA